MDPGRAPRLRLGFGDRGAFARGRNRGRTPVALRIPRDALVRRETREFPSHRGLAVRAVRVDRRPRSAGPGAHPTSFLGAFRGSRGGGSAPRRNPSNRPPRGGGAGPPPGPPAPRRGGGAGPRVPSPDRPRAPPNPTGPTP